MADNGEHLRANSQSTMLLVFSDHGQLPIQHPLKSQLPEYYAIGQATCKVHTKEEQVLALSENERKGWL